MALAAPALALDETHAHGAAPAGSGIHFPVTCSPAAQQRFDRAMTLQHSFWYQAAGEGFRETRETDASCIMASWGEALTLLLNPFTPPTETNLQRGQALLAEARRIGAKSDREAGLIQALANVFATTDRPGHAARLRQYASAMEALHNRFPQDAEVAIQYGLALVISASPGDKTYANQLRAAAILDRESIRQPQHPGVAHYLIHTYDVPALAPRGLDAASRYADLAPDAPHALHMPSHIFTRVGAWQRSASTNARSAEVARHNREIDDELHAVDYMAYAYLQMAQDDAARQVMEQLARTDTSRVARNAGFYTLAAVPARWALERGDWAAAAQLQPQPSSFSYTTAMGHFARVLGLARSGRPAEAAADIEALRGISAGLQSRDPYWADQVEIQRLVAEGWAGFAAGQQEAGLALLRQGSEREAKSEKHPVTPGWLAPARELYAEALLEAGQSAAALAEFEQVLTTEPNRFRAEAGAGRAAAAAGDAEAARRHYARLLEIAA
jgi:tetratricopeptide (TPR) repeat protein